MQGTISFDGTLSGGISGGGGGGSDVTITPALTEGKKIADYSIDSESGSLYAPTPEELPDTIVTKALRKYNDDTQTKIMTITTLDTENSQEVSQDIYAPSPVQCWYTPGLEQDYEIGKFTYGEVTQNVYIPNFQRPLTAGANITIDADNVISASSGGSSWNYSTSEVNTGQKWIDGKAIYQKTFEKNIVTTTTDRAWYTVITSTELRAIDAYKIVIDNNGTYIEDSTGIYGCNYSSMVGQVGGLVGGVYDKQSDIIKFCIAGISTGSKSIKITIRYTKITD